MNNTKTCSMFFSLFLIITMSTTLTFPNQVKAQASDFCATLPAGTTVKRVENEERNGVQVFKCVYTSNGNHGLNGNQAFYSDCPDNHTLLFPGIQNDPEIKNSIPKVTLLTFYSVPRSGNRDTAWTVFNIPGGNTYFKITVYATCTSRIDRS